MANPHRESPILRSTRKMKDTDQVNLHVRFVERVTHTEGLYSCRRSRLDTNRAMSIKKLPAWGEPLVDWVLYREKIPFDLDSVAIKNIELGMVLDKCVNMSASDWAGIYGSITSFVRAVYAAQDSSVELKRTWTSRDIHSKKTKPSFVAHANRCLVLMGEEQDSTTCTTNVIHSLKTKMQSWNSTMFCSLPYVFAYAAAGKQFSVVAINNAMETLPLVDAKSLLVSEDRARVLRVLANVAALIPHMDRHCFHENPTGILPMEPFKPIGFRRQIVEWSFVGVELTLLKRDEEGRDDSLKKLRKLETLTNGNVSRPLCLQRVKCVTSTAEKIFVTLTPVGYERRPTNAEEVKHWLQCMLSALAQLHAHGLVHGMVEWSRVGYVSAHGNAAAYWLLKSIDYADLTSCTMRLKREDGVSLTNESDLRQLGQLVQSLDIEVSKSVDSLVVFALNKGTNATASEILQLMDECETFGN